MLLDTPASEVLDQQKEEQLSVQYNITPVVKEEICAYLKKIVDDCESARSEWLEIREECLDLYNQIRVNKSDPWEGCSNITVGVVPMHVNLMHSKLFPAVWSNDRVYWKPTEKSDIENVEQVQKFMDWVVRQEMKLGDNVDDILKNLVLEGTVALKTRWETKYRNIRDKKSTSGYKEVAYSKAILENVQIDQVYLPRLWKYDSERPEDEAEFIGQKLFYRLPELKDLRRQGIFPISEEDLKKVTDAIEDTIGDTLAKKKDDAAGLAEFYAHLNSMPIEVHEFMLKYEINGEFIDSVLTVDLKSGVVLSAKPLTAIAPIGKRPWTIGQFIRRVGSPYGIGLAELMKGLAHELDAIHNQRIDAGSMSINPLGVYRAASSFKPELVQTGPGVMVPVDDVNDVKFVQVPSNLMVSFQEERIIIEYIEKITSTSSFQMGRQSDIVRSHATATGTMAIINQGEQAYTVLGMRAQRIMARAMTNILHTYQSFMPDDMALRVLGEDAQLLFPDGLTPENIAGGFDAYMVLDATVGNKSVEQQAKAAIVQNYQALLTMAQDPRGYRIAANWLKSIGEINIESILGPPPQPKQQPTAEGMVGSAPIGPQPNGLSQSLSGGGANV